MLECVPDRCVEELHDGRVPVQASILRQRAYHRKRVSWILLFLESAGEL